MRQELTMGLHFHGEQVHDEALKLRDEWLVEKEIQIKANELFEVTGKARFSQRTTIEELDAIWSKCDEEIGRMVDCDAIPTVLDRLARSCIFSYTASNVERCVKSLKMLREAHRNQAILHMQLEDYIYLNPGLLPLKNDILGGSQSLDEEYAPFWYELGEACLLLLNPFMNETGPRSESIRTRLLQHWDALIEIEAALPDILHPHGRFELSPLLVMTMSNFGQHFIQDIKLIRAIIKARPEGARIDPSAFHALPNTVLPHATSLRSAIVAVARKYVDTHGKAFERIEDEQFDEHHTVLDELQSIRDQAQELAPTLCLSNRKLSASDEHKCELLIQRYEHFLGTSQGQSYRQSLVEFDKAELIYLRKSFHVEHKRNILEQEKPTYNFRQLFTEGLCESFWDQLGCACKSFLDGPQNDIEEDKKVYSKLTEKDKLASNTPRTQYIAIFNAFELLNRYLSVNKREPSGTLYNQVLSLSHAGRHLIDYYILIEGIVKAAPEPELDGKRYPIIDHPDDFLRLDVRKAQLRHRPDWAHAIQQVATNYGKLLKFDASSNVVPMVELPRLTNRKERLYRSRSSSRARSAAELH